MSEQPVTYRPSENDVAIADTLFSSLKPVLENEEFPKFVDLYVSLMETLAQHLPDYSKDDLTFVAAVTLHTWKNRVIKYDPAD